MNSAFMKAYSSNKQHPLRPLKLALTNMSPTKKELYILVVNRSKESFYQKSVAVMIGNMSYKGDIYSKQLNTYNLHQAIPSGEMGVIVIPIKSHTWSQCEKLQIDLGYTDNNNSKRSYYKRQSNYLRLHDNRYASTCTHLD